MYRGFWLWGARSVVFYGGLSLLELFLLTKLRSRVGPLKKDRRVRGGRGREVGGAGCDECIEGFEFGRLDLLFFSPSELLLRVLFVRAPFGL